MEVSRGKKSAFQPQAEEGAKIVLEIDNRDRMALGKEVQEVEEKDNIRKIIILNSRREFHQPLGGY